MKIRELRKSTKSENKVTAKIKAGHTVVRITTNKWLRSIKGLISHVLIKINISTYI